MSVNVSAFLTKDEAKVMCSFLLFEKTFPHFFVTYKSDLTGKE